MSEKKVEWESIDESKLIEWLKFDPCTPQDLVDPFNKYIAYGVVLWDTLEEYHNPTFRKDQLRVQFVKHYRGMTQGMTQDFFPEKVPCFVSLGTRLLRELIKFKREHGENVSVRIIKTVVPNNRYANEYQVLVWKQTLQENLGKFSKKKG